MKNGKPTSVESRLAKLEDDVREIKRKLESSQPKQGWTAIIGSQEPNEVSREIHRITMDLIEKERERDKRRFDRQTARLQQKARG